MTVPANIDALLLGGQKDYQIERSLRFNSADSTYLNRTPASAGNRKTWTWSGWVKRGALSSFQRIFVADGGAARDALLFNDTNTISFWFNDASSGVFTTTAVFRDCSAWYHIVLAVDTTQATNTNRFKFYVNNASQSFSSVTYPSQNYDGFINNNVVHNIGRQPSGIQYVNGYLTEINFIDGQALTPSSFGETDAITGVWKPKKYTGTYGTNGFYLNFSDNSGTTSTTLGKDSSGNGNNWTPNNFSVTAGAGNDSMIDTPTPYADGGNGRGNYATLNTVDKSATANTNVVNGSLDLTTSANWDAARATIAANGKFYFEVTNNVTLGATVGFTAGFQTSQLTLNSISTARANEFRIISSSVTNVQSGTTTLFSPSVVANGETIQFAIDVASGKAWLGRGSSWYNSSGGTTGDPATGANPTFTFTASEVYLFAGGYSANLTCNFGQRPFAYTPPSGFKALNTQNLPEPSIKKPSSFMDVVTYTGTGSALTPTSSLGFSPDLVWIKSRSAATDHALYDAVRGVEKRLESNNTDQEVTSDGGVTAFNSGGFTLGTLAQVNTNTATYAAWCWDESATPGFDIVTYTGDGVNTRTISHNLGVTPAFFITKNRDGYNSSQGFVDWSVYHQNLAAYNTTGSQALYLMSTTNAGAAGGFFTRPTSTVFTPNQTGYDNVSTRTYVAYLWSEVAGFSRFGSYTGNGSTDGPFVFCGFRPAVVIVKMSSSSGNWTILDSKREGYNVDNDPLYPNGTSAEGTTDLIDITSSGFKVRTTDATFNTSSGTYIYCAWAESPFKYSLAR